MITALHGIGAYRGQRNPVALSRALTVAISGVEICASDKAIGAFGVVVLGASRVVWDRDVWSELDSDGNRISNCQSGFIAPQIQADFEDFATVARENGTKYCEVWMRASVLRAVWIKKWADARTTAAARIIAKNRHVPLLTITGRTRIGELLDTRLDNVIVHDGGTNDSMRAALIAAKKRA
jgi:hypothetical protein